MDDGSAAGGLVLGGRFLLGDLLGVGGSASVYGARDMRDGTAAAVKILHPHLCTDDAARQAFLSEAARVSGLIHPNIVRVRGSGLHDAGGVVLPWIAMDLVEGPSLAEWVERSGRLTVADAAHLFDGVLAGLGAAHAAGIVHRDVSPRNIIVEGVGSPGGDGPGFSAASARLLDFGLADASGHNTRSGDVLLAGPASDDADLVVGNPFYMSPEEAQGLPVRAASDLYQAGGCLYFALTGSPPFPRPSGREAMAAHVSAPPPVPSALAPAARQLDRVVTLAMAKAPVRRFRDAQAFRAALITAAGIGAAAEPGPDEHATPTTAVGAAPGPGATATAVTTVLRQPGDDPAASGAASGQSATRVIPQQMATSSLGYLDPVPGEDGPGFEGPAPGGGNGVGGIIAAVFVIVLGIGVALAWSATSHPGTTPVSPPAASSPSSTLSAPASSAVAPPSVAVPSQTPSAPGPAAPTTPPPQVVPVGEVVVPALSGQSLMAAQRLLEAQGLVLGRVDRVNSPEPADMVVSQGTVVGASVARGSAVDVVVASGWNTVPDVVGRDVTTASAMLQSMGFVVAGDGVGVPGSASVVATRPAAGVLSSVGTPITLTVAQQSSTPSTTPSTTPSGRQGNG